MTIFNVFTLLGGLAFFLYGMNVLSSGLEKLAGGKLESMLRKVTSNPFKSLLLGAGITIAIQSSSAMTVMLVGLVNSGIMQLGQTVGVIMGSNIGTTLTAWILSMAGIEGDNFFVQLLKPSSFSPILALIGIIMIMVAKSDKKRSIGSLMVGFAVLMYGMDLMQGAMEPLQEMEEFQKILTAFNNPLLGVIVGAAFTGIIQSSAASMAILQSLAMSGGITFGMAIPIIMGQNIGTCVTALLASIGVNRNAKRVAVVHISFNLIGTIVWLVLFYGLDAFLHFAILDQTIDAVGIAAVHSIFNVLTTFMLLPFSKMLEKIANMVVKDTEKKEEYAFIDERLLATPSVAIAECSSKTKEMARVAQNALMDAIQLLEAYDPAVRARILKDEDELDLYEDKLGTHLVKLPSREISLTDSKTASKLLHTIGDFERIGDHAVNLIKTAEEMHEKKIHFSDEAMSELHILTDAVTEILDLTTESFVKNDLVMAARVEPLEQVIDRLISTIKNKHILRLQAGNCTIEMGFILNDLLTNYERVSDHCSNIAVAVIETEQNAYEAHEYLNDIKHSGNPVYEADYQHYQGKYAIEP